ncbi:Aldo/keto reductase [Parathielavia appendiculata]|uniref:Aldo/keto reductase n=1 Tax=Parathielavia appendiculata TaxID=2587402 RepID=A0AAN6TUB2_9PEZI|nr:Aldo/keto reductase [Parathielavia appendiculata]
MSLEMPKLKPTTLVNEPEQPEYIPHLNLSDGNELPMRGPNRDKRDEKLINDTLTAIRNGYYLLDCAEDPNCSAYGNEPKLGASIARCGIPTSNLFITTEISCRPGDSVETVFSRSLAKLGLDYVDLYPIHSPFLAQPAAVKLEAVLRTARHPPVVNQIEYYPYLQHEDKNGSGGLVQFHREKGIAIVAYAFLTGVVRTAPGPLDGVYERLAGNSNEERLKRWVWRLPLFKLTSEEVEEIAKRGRERHFRGF